MNQACKSNFKTHVEKLNPTSRTDLSNKTPCSILALGQSLGPRGAKSQPLEISRGTYFPIHPSSRQCTDTFFEQLIPRCTSKCVYNYVGGLLTWLNKQTVGDIQRDKWMTKGVGVPRDIYASCRGDAGEALSLCHFVQPAHCVHCACGISLWSALFFTFHTSHKYLSFIGEETRQDKTPSLLVTAPPKVSSVRECVVGTSKWA